MGDLELIELDDIADGSGNHLTDAQRLSAFESWWHSLSAEKKCELVADERAGR